MEQNVRNELKFFIREFRFGGKRKSKRTKNKKRKTKRRFY
jgi:hypothetical protein